MAIKNVPKKTKTGGVPKLDRFIRPGKETLYVTYAQAASFFSLPYYTMVKCAKEAKANIHIRKGVLVDMTILMNYMENELREKGD